MGLTKNNFLELASRYDHVYRMTDEKVEKKIKLLLRKQRYLMRANLIKLACWKSNRPRRYYESNDDQAVREVTRFSFGTPSERARIESLLVLKGVGWPVASAILHFAFPDEYPIMDFRAIRSLGWTQPQTYDFDFWKKYCNKIGSLARTHKLSIRTVEKALWMYDKVRSKNRPCGRVSS